MIDVLITGGGGMLAYALKHEFARRGHRIEAPARSELDVTDETTVHDYVRRLRPKIIVQCAAWTKVDDAESHEEDAFRVNALGTKFAAEAAHQVGARFVFPSTDYVFDGSATQPYKPDDEPNPINAYGRTKLAGEEAARLAGDYLIVRLSWLYGPGGRNFVRTVAERLKRGEPLRVIDDQVGRPSWTMHAAEGVAALLDAKVEAGVYHWANDGVATWHDVAVEIARAEGGSGITACKTSDYSTPATRPMYSVLETGKADQLIGRSADWRRALIDALARGDF